MGDQVATASWGVDLGELTDQQLIEQVRSKRDERALEELIRRYRPVARARARTFYMPGASRDDIIQEGLIGLYKAIRDYDPGNGAPFSAFVKLCVSRQILTAVKNSSRQKHGPLNAAVSLDAPLNDDGGVQTLGETLDAGFTADPHVAVASSQEIEALREQMKSDLTALESDVLELYMRGHSYDEIARAVGSHAKSIDNALQRLRTKLRHGIEQRNGAS